VSLVITGQHINSLPFASPLIAIDDLTWQTATSAVATKQIVAMDPYLEGHYPDFTIYPGVFTIETVFQAAATALGVADTDLEISSIKSVRFQAPLLPGDRLTATLRFTPVDDDTAAVDVAADCRRGDGTACATIRLRVAPRHVAGPVGVLSHADIRRLLPHRNPMLHVDRVDELIPMTRIVAVKAISGSETCYRHLREDAAPEAYRYPTSLIVESMGQAGGVLWIHSLQGDMDPSKKLIFGYARGLTVHGAAYPGDVLRHIVHVTSVKGDNAFATGETWVGDRLIATCDDILVLLRADTTLAP